MTSDLELQIAKLQTSARNARDARNPAQREAARTFLIRRATDIRSVRDELMARLDAGYDFLRDHPGRSDHDANEDQLIGWLHTYEQVEDALNEAAATWLDPVPVQDEVPA